MACVSSWVSESILRRGAVAGVEATIGKGDKSVANLEERRVVSRYEQCEIVLEFIERSAHEVFRYRI